MCVFVWNCNDYLIYFKNENIDTELHVGIRTIQNDDESGVALAWTTKVSNDDECRI